jgi:hypothetical protein
VADAGAGLSRDVDVAVAEPEAVPGQPSTRQRPERMRRSLTRTGAYLVLVALEDQPAALAHPPTESSSLARMARVASASSL